MSPSHDILVINDRALDAHETLIALEQVAPRARVLHLCDSEEALQYLFSVGLFVGRAPGLPKLVLLSLDLNAVSGLCLLDLMRAHPLTCAIPVVVLSLDDDVRRHRRRDQFAANAYILKPLDFQRYCSVIQGCVRHWLPAALGHRPVQRVARNASQLLERPSSRESQDVFRALP